jgi:hypothetical protein
MPISLAEIDSPELRDILAIWNERRQNRSMPTRENIVPRALGHLVRNVSLVGVISGEEDYEFRVVGGVHVQAYGVNQQGKRLSDVLIEAPGFGGRLKASLDTVVETRAPLAYRGKIGRDVGNARFVWLETAFLPLGTSDAVVDHILIATVYAPLNGIWPN